MLLNFVDSYKKVTFAGQISYYKNKKNI